MRFLTIFIFLMLSSFSLEASEIKNLIIYEEPKKYDNLSFLDDIKAVSSFPEFFNLNSNFNILDLIVFT